MAESVDCAVIGAGVVGLAVARALALGGREVLVLEAAEAVGTGASSRNSEVIHAGIYYAKDSLKARLCVRGRDMLYAYLADRGVAHRRLGKFIVATAEPEVARLEDLRARGEANGVDDLEWLDGAAARRLEPALRAEAALLSPSSGILDSHGLMLALAADAEAAGATIALRSPVAGGRLTEGSIGLGVGSSEPMELCCRAVVNCAGLGAQQVASRLQGLPPATIPRRHLAKGSYFALAGRSPFKRLIYPVPDAASLGIHLALDLAGRARFGPDVEWVESEDYGVDPGRAEGFYRSVRRYWPELPEGALRPDYAGIRAKIQGPGDAPADFVIQGPDRHGIHGLVNLYGIESPGLTASLAIGEAVAETLR